MGFLNKVLEKPEPDRQPYHSVWQYKVLRAPTQESLNEWGAQGWEVTAVKFKDGGVFAMESALLKRHFPAGRAPA